VLTICVLFLFVVGAVVLVVTARYYANAEEEYAESVSKRDALEAEVRKMRRERERNEAYLNRLKGRTGTGGASNEEILRRIREDLGYSAPDDVIIDLR